jgi:hypothetical protein
MKIIPETRRAHCARYLRFYYSHWVDTSADGHLTHEGIISLRETMSLLFVHLEFE